MKFPDFSFSIQENGSCCAMVWGPSFWMSPFCHSCAIRSVIWWHLSLPWDHEVELQAPHSYLRMKSSSEASPTIRLLMCLERSSTPTSQSAHPQHKGVLRDHSHREIIRVPDMTKFLTNTKHVYFFQDTVKDGTLASVRNCSRWLSNSLRTNNRWITITVGH